MKKLSAIYLSLAAILSLSSCQKDEHIMNPYTKADSGTEVTAEPVEYVPGSLLVDGENFKMFGFEFTGSPKDYPEIENYKHPEWLDLEEEESGMYAKLMRFDDDESLKQHYRLDYEPIDWSKKTLLLAYGRELYMQYPATINYEGKEKDKYQVSVNVVRGGIRFCSILYWRVAILVDKLDADAIIEVQAPDYIPAS